jgi:serine/threonine-protein kinase
MPDAPACPHCGHPSEPGDQFCLRCGGALAGPHAPAAAAGGREEADAESPWRAVLVRLEAVTQGRFTIERELGEGGMAAVYLARDLSLQRRVAIKVLSPAMLMERGMVGRFKQEAVTIAAMRHPHIVTVHGVEHHDQLHFFVLDYVEGGSLQQVLNRYGPLPLPAAMAWLSQVAAALEYAHRRNVVHRDIKPGNILLDHDGNAIVTDFGIAKVAEKSGFTQTGTTMGTPSYMSPEQCLARPVGPPSDQYALGIVAYEMLTGRVPFSGSPLEVMRSHTDDVPAPVTDARPDCPPALAQVVARMLAKDPSARWPNLAEAMAACGAAPPGLGAPVWEQMAGLVRGDSSIPTVGSDATPTTPLPGRQPVSAARRVPPGGLVGAGLVAAAAVIGGIFLLRGGPEPPQEPASAVTTEVPAGTPTDTLQAHETTGEQAAPPSPRTDSQPAPAPVAASVRVTPATITLAAGETRTLDAVALDAAGRPIAGRARWTTGNTAIATVSADGIVTGGGAGTTEVVAVIGSRRASATVTVTAAVETAEGVASVTLSPEQLDLTAGQGATLAATVTGTRGSRLADRAVTWRSSNTAVAAVSGDGRVTAVAPGVAIVSATADGRAAQAAVTVRAATPAISDADAGRLIRQWIDRFATRLDAAIRQGDLAAVRRAYEAPMGGADTAEWQQRLAVAGANWQARLARAYDPRRVGSTWLGDFELTIVVQASGQRRQVDQRFSAVFEPGADGRLTVTSLVMLLADR